MKMSRKFLALIALSGLASFSYSQSVGAQNWTLTDQQRRAYLYYYAPVIFKRANENNGKKGYDWILNFYFDQDNYFSSNLASGQQLPNLVAAAALGHSTYAQWRLRPTLYTALIEFKDTGKELILLYHIYHAMDQDYINPLQNSSRPPDKIHDWERVEIHLKNVVGSPGTGELVNYVAVTQHHQSVVRTGAQAKFMDTPTGRHVMVWQAEWSSRTTAPRGGELRFVEDTYSYISNRWNQVVMANVDVNDDGRKNVHYVFVPDQEPGAVSASGAKGLSYTTAEKLASGWDNGTTISWNGVKRITYELQDVADIIPTHWAGGVYQPHWGQQGDELIKFDPEGLVNESGLMEVPGGGVLPETFYTAGLISTGGTDREGFPAKPWLWGSYNMNNSACNGTDQIPNGCPGKSFESTALTGSFLDWRGMRRQDANGLQASATTDPETSFWWQHDYFVHYGYTDEIADYSHRCTTGSPFQRLFCQANYAGNMDPGFWLTGSWYTAANGGFDGRWIQLFDDRADEELYTPLEVEIVGSSSGCAAKTVTAHVSGGRSPYVVTWLQWVGYQTSAPHSSWAFQANTRGELQVSSSDGQSRTYTVHCAIP